MVEHIVLIRFKASAERADREQILRELAALPDRIPGIVSYRAGFNTSDRGKGYDAAIRSTFTDQASLDAYGPHPEHQKLARRLGELSDDIVVSDFRPLS